MNEASNIDYAGLAAYISGECSAEQRKYWEKWIRESEDNRKTYQACLKLLETDHAALPKSWENFDSTEAWARVSARLEPATKEIKPLSNSISWLKYAAVFVIGALLLTYLIREKFNSTFTVEQLSGVQTYYLPDSSEVTLNGKASISYPQDFNSRNIELSGTAFFNVRNRENAPFIVNTSETYVRVLGTAFLIEQSDDSVMVKVEHGLVEFGLKESEQQIQLTKNEEGKIVLATNRLSSSTITDLNDLYWATKNLTYRQAALSDVLDKLSTLFNRKISYNKDMLTNCTLTAVFRDQPLEQILRNIALSVELEYQIKDDEVIIEKANCN